jgi:hypothetical protein
MPVVAPVIPRKSSASETAQVSRSLRRPVSEVGTRAFSFRRRAIVQPSTLADPQVRAREMIVQMEHPIMGPVQTLRQPAKFSRSRTERRHDG